MSALISGLVGGAVAVALVAVAERGQRSARMGTDGWRELRSSWLLHSTFVGCIAFTAFIAYFLLSGGSSRADADSQNLYALALGVGFALGAVCVGWNAYARTIAWKGNELRVRTIFGHELVRPISEVRSVEKRDVRGDYRIEFRDGSSLACSAYLHGVQDLVEQLSQAAHED